MRTIKNNKLFNLNLFPVAIIAAAALSGLGCGDDGQPYCEAEALQDGYYKCQCYNEDDERSGNAIIFRAGDETVPGDCFVPPADGTGGTDNTSGSCTVENVTGGAQITCPDGTATFIADGSNGSNGTDGTDGLDGTGCTVEQVNGGALITCSDGSSAFIPGGGTGCTPSQEVCNGRDDDCDGYVDEGLNCGGTTCTPTTEVCDGVDNDCDGYIDEDNVCGGTATGSWQVLAMEVLPSDQTLTCNGQPIVPSTACSGTVGFNRAWIEQRTNAVYNGTFTQLSLLGGNGYQESFQGLLGGYCAVRNSSTLGSQVNVNGAPVGASIRIANGSAYSENGSTVTFGFESHDSGPAVVCWLAIDQTSFQAY